MGSTLHAMAGSVMPSMFKSTPSAAELASADSEGYAEPGLSEHKVRPCCLLSTLRRRHVGLVGCAA